MELKDYITPLLKWWWLIVASIAVAVASTFVSTRDQPPLYQTTTTLMVGRFLDDPNPTGGEFGLSQQLAQAYAEIVRRSPVRSATMEALGLPGLPPYYVRVVPNTQLLEISVVDTNPLRAQAIADELAIQLIALSPVGTGDVDQQRQDFVNEQLDELETSIQETQAEITDLQDVLATMSSARQIADTQTQIAGLESKVRSLQANYASMLSNTKAGATNSLRIVEPATLPFRPLPSTVRSTLLLAAAIGFLLAAGGTYLLEYLDDTLKTPEIVKEALGLTALGAIPEGDQVHILNGAGPSSNPVSTEAYRILRNNLQFTAGDTPLKLLLITSPTPSEGKSLTVANLGISLAQIGYRVILVDADLHQPQLHKFFEVSNTAGLADALRKDSSRLDEILVQTKISGVKLLPAGSLLYNSGNWLDTPLLEGLLMHLQARADIVVVDTPPVSVLADAVVLSRKADGVILVFDARRTRKQVAQKAMDALAQVGAPLIGVVLNRVRKSRDRYGYYGRRAEKRGRSDGAAKSEHEQ